MKSTPLRYSVTLAAVAIGIGLAAWDLSTVAPTWPAPDPDAPRRTPPEVSRAIFDACVTFYGCVYAVGKTGYRLLGRDDEAEVLGRWSRWHMWVLNGVGGVWLCASSWQSFNNLGVIRPAAVVGAVLLGLSLASTVAAASRAAGGRPADR